MKKFLKFLGIGVVSIAILAGLILLYINFSGIPTYSVEKIGYHIKSTPQSVERGHKLTMMLCANCHMNGETEKLTGQRMLDVPPSFGEVHSMNITQDKTNGIGNWSDGELLYLLRTGIEKSGRFAPPPMVKLPNMADEDINAIISFLRSNDPMVAADPVPNIPSKPSLLLKVLCRVAFKPLPIPIQKIEMPDTTKAVAEGRYLAYNLQCYACHSADFSTNNDMDPSKSKGYFGGGNKLLDLEGRTMLALNLSPDKKTGIGSWSKDEFIQALKDGRVKGQKALRFPMEPYPELTDKEAGDIYEYVMTIPPIRNKVVRSVYN